MDNADWHPRSKATQQEEDELSPFRGPGGQFLPVAQGESMEGVTTRGRAIGTRAQPSSHLAQPDGSRNAGTQLGVRAPSPAPSSRLVRTGYPFVRQPVSSQSDVGEVTRTSFDQNSLSQFNSGEAVERPNAPNVRRKMNPRLQLMCGPLLRYDTIDEYEWRGAALIVTADTGSIYEPYPTLKYRWDSQQLEIFTVLEQCVPGTELYVHGGRNSTCTFWRFLIRIPLSDSEMKIQYSINDGPEEAFSVPGRHQTMRLAAYSCNGFNPGVSSKDFRGPLKDSQSGYDPLWIDMLAKHDEQPFHLLVGGGDQLYCDGVAREPELQEWINHPDRKEKMHYPLTQEILGAIDRFYFNHYCRTFSNGAFARANRSIPMLNMLDDNDLIDGFGSYPDELQKAPVFNTIGSRGYFYFLLFQCFINVVKDGTDERAHPIKSTVIGARGEYIPYPSHSILTYIGPTASLLMLDCRAERKLGQICSEEQYARVFKRMNALPPVVEHLIVQLGIPIVYPRMGFLESMLSSKYNFLVKLGRSESLGLKGFVNKFNGDAELLDDLNDRWTSKRNMGERNMFIERLQQYALSRRIRISFLTGDVHCASVGRLKTLTKGKRSSAPAPRSDHRYMLNVVSSAMVNAPPPASMLTLADMLSTKRFRELHYTDTDEEMVPLFEKDTDGSKPKSLYIMGRRNWCRITLEQPSGDLLFDIRVEKEKGHGETVSYPILAPPPRWTPKAIK